MTPPVQPGLWGERHALADLEGRILQLVGQNPELANRDRALALAVWAEEGGREAVNEGWAEFEEWFREQATSYDSISRCRRKLVAAGLIRPDPEVAQVRREMAEHHRRFFGRGR